MKRILLLVVLLPSLVLAQTKTYIALGDSLAWGYQPNSTSRGNGDKGYVKQVADWLGSRNSGVRPVLINLGVPGETSASFFDTSEVGALLNSNYPILGRKSQSVTFGTKVANELSAGHVIANVTCALGGNDLLDLLTDTFLAQPFDTQKAQVDQALAQVDANFTQILTRVRQLCPASALVVPGYYNPYGAFPGTPVDNISKYAIPKLNDLLAARASQFGGRFAGTYLAFVGHELDYTWIGENDIHPRDPGYTVMAQRIEFAWRAPGPVVGAVRVDWP